VGKKTGKLLNNKGIALIFTLFTITFLSILIFGFVSLAQLQSRTTTNLHLSQQAYYAARTGLNFAINEIENDFNRDPQIASCWEESDRKISDDIYFDIFWEPINPKSPVKLWKIISTGKIKTDDDVIAARTLTAWVEMGTFANYTYLSDSEVRSTGPVYHCTGQKMEGRVHTNGYFNILGNPAFVGRVTSANGLGKNFTIVDPTKHDPYWDPNTRTYKQDLNTRTDPAKFYHYVRSYSEDYPIAADGSISFCFAGGAPEVPLPPNNDTLAAKAQYKFDRRIYVDFFQNGEIGIGWYVYSNEGEPVITLPDDMDSPPGYSKSYETDYTAFDPTPVSRHRFIAMSSRQVTIGIPTPTPTLKPTPTPTTTNSPPPSSKPEPVVSEWRYIKIPASSEEIIIHSSGNVTIRSHWPDPDKTSSLPKNTRGIVKGKFTLSAGTDIYLWGSVVYADKNRDSLGLVAQRDIVVSTSTETKNKDLHVHASIMALQGSLRTLSYDKGVPRGTLKIFGGVIQYRPGFNGTVCIDENGEMQLLTGYKTTYQYDPKIGRVPPPGYPTSGKLQFISIKDDGCFEK
jgi:hypothetical protein